MKEKTKQILSIVLRAINEVLRYIVNAKKDASK